jgi:hypothetical protein
LNVVLLKIQDKYFEILFDYEVQMISSKFLNFLNFILFFFVTTLEHTSYSNLIIHHSTAEQHHSTAQHSTASSLEFHGQAKIENIKILKKQLQH